MRRHTKFLLITATLLTLIGSISFTGVMFVLNWDFSKLSTKNYVTTNHIVDKTYHDINIDTDIANITFAHSEDHKTTVVCYEDDAAKHTVAVVDGTLEIKTASNQKWYDHIGINVGSPKITVYLPTSEYGKLTIGESTGNIVIPDGFHFENMDITTTTGGIQCRSQVSEKASFKASTGKITLNDVSAETIDISVSTGKITAENITCSGDFTVSVSTGDASLNSVTCKSLITTGSTGELHLTDVIATETFRIERDTGDIKFDRCDASEIYVKTDTGHVKGTLLTDKVYIIQTDTGNIDVPKTTTGGKCEITTDTGDIRIQVAQ